MSIPVPFPSAATLHEHVLAMADQRGAKLAISAPGGDWSWSGLAERIRAAADALGAAGLQGGERLVIVSENSPSTVVLLVAAQLLRGWPAVINARLPQAEVLRMVDCAQPRLVLFSLEGSPAVAAHAEALQACDFQVEGLGPLRLLQRTPTLPAQAASPDPRQEVGSLIFTSGTTGQPKAVMITHLGMLNHGWAVGIGRGARVGDTIDVAAPLSHVMGHSSVLVGLVFGAALRIQPRLTPTDLVRAIAAGEVSQASMVPVGWARMLEQIDKERVDLSGHRLHSLVSGGAPLDPELKARIEKAFGMPVQNAYGMTEVAPLARTPRGHQALPWSVGRPESNVEVRIVGGDGQPVAEGEVGEIWARGPSVTIGYFANPQATAEVLREGGWFASGDLGRWLPDGTLAVVGRAKEMIIRSGFNVYPAEVEGAIASHPAVLHAAVVGEPAGLGDETVVAYVQLREAHRPDAETRKQLEEHVRSQLAPYKCPAHFEFVEGMPLGSTGKILKRELRRAA